MAELVLSRRSPLASYVDRFAAAGRDDTVRLREVPFRSLVDTRGDPIPDLRGGTLLRLGPDWWLLVDAAPPSDPDAAVPPSDPDAAGVVDVSAQRTTLELRGPRVHDVLMTGCALDLDALAVGGCTQTLLAQAQVILHRTARDTYRVLVRASYAAYLADWLLDAMLEHGGEEPGAR
jgi:sarcosine oxidase subunit alpha